MTPIDRGIAWLNSADVRVTRQRIALAELLVGDGQQRHVCAEDLHGQVKDGEAPVSLATVYNTLRAFSDAGLLREVRVDGRSLTLTRVWMITRIIIMKMTGPCLMRQRRCDRRGCERRA